MMEAGTASRTEVTGSTRGTAKNEARNETSHRNSPLCPPWAAFITPDREGHIELVPERSALIPPSTLAAQHQKPAAR